MKPMAHSAVMGRRCLVCLVAIDARSDLCPTCQQTQPPAWLLRYRRMLRLQGRGPFRVTQPAQETTR